jgi:hypothetical protein
VSESESLFKGIRGFLRLTVGFLLLAAAIGSAIYIIVHLLNHLRTASSDETSSIADKFKAANRPLRSDGRGHSGRLPECPLGFGNCTSQGLRLFWRITENHPTLNNWKFHLHSSDASALKMSIT